MVAHGVEDVSIPGTVGRCELCGYRSSVVCSLDVVITNIVIKAQESLVHSVVDRIMKVSGVHLAFEQLKNKGDPS